MNCSDCQAKICDLSADALNSSDAILMREHLEDCATCKQELIALERALFCVSCLEQPLPTPLATEQMWNRCFEHIFQKVEAERAGGLKSSFAAEPEYSRPRLSWFSRQPRWSWATLGAAAAILGGVWFLTPQENSTTVAERENFPTASDSPGELVALRRPSGAASVLVNHHSAMSVDPFTDYVGTTLVSYSATSPENSSRR